MHAHFWIVLDKPYGMSSNHALGKIKRLFGLRKAGFSGTLDPLATGVLPIAFGEALKTMHYMTFSKKAYTFQIRFGQRTTTDDAEGDVVESSDVRPRKDDIEAVLHAFCGVINQIPPIYSALKVDGKRAYDLARQGEAVDLKSRDVTIYDLKLLSMDNADHATFHVECSAGTYVRSLARDIAQSLGTVGHVSMLRRTAVGVFDESHAISLEKLSKIVHTDAIHAYKHPVGIGLDDILAISITRDEYAECRLGRKIHYPVQQQIISREPLEGSLVGMWVVEKEKRFFAGFAHYEQGELSPKRLINDLGIESETI